MEVISLYMIFFGVAVLGWLIHLFLGYQSQKATKAVDLFLMYWLVIVIGLSSLMWFVFHVFYPDWAANMLDWPTNNPFQFEVGMANLGLGVLGVCCLWKREAF